MKTQSPMSVTAPKMVAAPGQVSKMAPTGAAPKPSGIKNTRDYGKPAPAAPVGLGATPSPFGPTDGGSRIGGI